MKKSLLLLFSLVFIIAFVSIDIDASRKNVNQQFDFVSDYLMEMEMEDITLKDTEILKDFNNNQYYLCNLYPVGYAIFDAYSKEFIEGSFESNSPYFGFKNSKYYLGPSNYFVRKNNLIYDIVNENYFNFSSELVKMSSKFNYSIQLSKNQNNTQSLVENPLNNQLQNVTQNQWVLINNHNYFRLLKDHPSASGGSCSFVALSNILGYLDTFYNDSIVSDSYIVKSYSADRSPGTNEFLKNKLLSYGYRSYPSITSNPATAIDILKTFYDYKYEFIPSNIRDYFNIVYKDNFLFKINDLSEVYNSINVNNPIILVMSSFYYTPDEDLPENVRGDWHTVTAYGYKGNKFITHFGWTGATQFILNSYIVISYIGINFVGIHEHSRNYVLSGTSTKCGCSHQCNYQYNIIDSSKHTKKCQSCYYNISENHIWETNAGITFCIRCGFRLDVSPWSYDDKKRS